MHILYMSHLQYLLSDVSPSQRRHRQIAIDVAQGLSYLHAHNVIHCNIKSPIILISHIGIAKVGCSRPLFPAACALIDRIPTCYIHHLSHSDAFVYGSECPLR